MVWPYLTIREEKLGLSELVRKYSAKNGFPHFLKNIEILCIRFKILFWNASESKEHTRKILARCWRNIKLVESLAAKLCKFKMWVRRSCEFLWLICWQCLLCIYLLFWIKLKLLTPKTRMEEAAAVGNTRIHQCDRLRISQKI